MNDKERIAELESIKADRRIAELEGDVKDLHADIARMTTEAYTRDAEVKMLREAMDKYSEDEMLLIERCAKEAEMWDSEPLSGRSIAACIRALKEEGEMKDIPTPESDENRFVSEYITQEDVVPYELSQSLEQRLAIAVAALKGVRDYPMTPPSMVDLILEALAQIESK